MYRVWVLVNLCLVGLHMNPNSVGASPIDGESLVDSSTLLEFKMPPSCADKNFCFESGTEYPTSKIKDLLDQLPFLPFNDRIGTEFRNDCDIDNECETEKEFSKKPIYYIRDQDDKVRAVVQSPRLEQIYSARWCKRPGRITYDTAHFVKGSPSLEKFNITCVETYMDFDFIVLTSDGKIEIAKPKGGIPVCCKCIYHQLN